MLDKLPEISPAYQQDFALEISRFNLKRGKSFVLIIVSIEIILLSLLVINKSSSTVFRYSQYAFMYALMIIVSIVFWVVLSYLEKRIEDDPYYVKILDVSATGFIVFGMVWGAVISLMDQALYGNIVVFLVNVFITTFIFYIKPTKILLAQVFATAVLFIGLPYYQPSANLLIGHYANASIFLIFLWYLSRTNYIGLMQNFLNQKIIEEKSSELTQANTRLLKEIQISERVQNELKTANQQLRVIASLDALTGIPNRRRLDEVLLELWNMAVEKELPFSIMMIDIDFFKLYNDTNGHLAGDRCLRAVAEVLNSCRRESLDFVARFGGEEFLFIAVGFTREVSLLLAEKIRSEVEALGIKHPTSSVAPMITVSIGLSHLYPNQEDKPDVILEKADQALYQAKANGRNRLVLSD